VAVDPDTGTEVPLLAQPTRGINPAWTVDGSRLAYNVVTSAGFDIAVVAADGTGMRSVVVGPASEERPRWSPDGRWLVYYSDEGDSWDVYVVDVVTGVSHPLTDGKGFDGQPAWQPVTAARTASAS
jgi:TolB protein